MSRGLYRSVVAPLAALLVALLVVTDGYRVLVVFPLAGKSHSILGDGYVRELLRKGHEVTYVTPFPSENPPVNLSEIDVSFTFDLLPFDRLMNVSKLLEGSNEINNNRKMFEHLFTTIWQKVLTHEAFQTLLQDTSKGFDLVIVEWFFTELFTGLSALYQCPLVWSSSMEVHPTILRLMDDIPNPMYLPDLMNTYSAPFSFKQRVEMLWNTFSTLRITESFTPVRAALHEEIFAPLAAKRGVTLPAYEEVLYNASFILTNSHPSLGGAPKLPQNIKGVGGYHIDLPTKPLPNNLQKLMDEAQHGVIYFSLGSNMKSKDMPAKIKNELVEMLGGLKQTVIWKFEEDIPNLPKNLHIQKWVPQTSVLAHPKIKVFITHGGLLSTTETIHYGVPIIGIPLFGDQFLNMEHAVDKGFAVRVPFSWNVVEDLKTAIDEALSNPSYRATVQRLSSLYHDRPLLPTEELVYWLEYVVRTGGARHLRPSALLMPWYQRHYVDLLALIVVALVSVVLFVRYLVRVCIMKFCNCKPQDQKKKRN